MSAILETGSTNTPNAYLTYVYLGSSGSDKFKNNIKNHTTRALASYSDLPVTQYAKLANYFHRIGANRVSMYTNILSFDPYSMSPDNPDDVNTCLQMAVKLNRRIYGKHCLLNVVVHGDGTGSGTGYPCVHAHCSVINFSMATGHPLKYPLLSKQRKINDQLLLENGMDTVKDVPERYTMTTRRNMEQHPDDKQWLLAHDFDYKLQYRISLVRDQVRPKSFKEFKDELSKLGIDVRLRQSKTKHGVIRGLVYRMSDKNCTIQKSRPRIRRRKSSKLGRVYGFDFIAQSIELRQRELAQQELIKQKQLEREQELEPDFERFDAESKAAEKEWNKKQAEESAQDEEDKRAKQLEQEREQRRAALSAAQRNIIANAVRIRDLEKANKVPKFMKNSSQYQAYWLQFEKQNERKYMRYSNPIASIDRYAIRSYAADKLAKDFGSENAFVSYNPESDEIVQVSEKDIEAVRGPQKQKVVQKTQATQPEKTATIVPGRVGSSGMSEEETEPVANPEPAESMQPEASTSPRYTDTVDFALEPSLTYKNGKKKTVQEIAREVLSEPIINPRLHPQEAEYQRFLRMVYDSDEPDRNLDDRGRLCWTKETIERGVHSKLRHVRTRSTVAESLVATHSALGFKRSYKKPVREDDAISFHKGLQVLKNIGKNMPVWHPEQYLRRLAGMKYADKSDFYRTERAMFAYTVSYHDVFSAAQRKQFDRQFRGPAGYVLWSRNCLDWASGSRNKAIRELGLRMKDAAEDNKLSAGYVDDNPEVKHLLGLLGQGGQSKKKQEQTAPAKPNTAVQKTNPNKQLGE